MKQPFQNYINITSYFEIMEYGNMFSDFVRFHQQSLTQNSVEFKVKFRKYIDIKVFLIHSLIQMTLWYTTFEFKTWASYQIRKIAGCACAGNAGNVFPATDFKGNC